MIETVVDLILKENNGEVLNYEDEIIELEEAKLSYYFLAHSSYSKIKNKRKHIDIIMKSKNPEFIYYLLCYFSNSVNTEECLDIIAKSGDAKFNYKVVEIYGFNIDNDKLNLDVSKNVKAILDSKDPEFNYMLSKKVKKHINYIDGLSDIERRYYSLSKDDEEQILDMCRDNIIKGNDMKYVYLFAKDVSNENLAEIVLNSKDGKYIYLFARDIRGADKQKHYRRVLESDNIEYIYHIAEELSNISDSKKINNIFRGKNMDIDVSDYLNYILNSKNPEYNYLVALNIKGCDKKAHLDTVIKSFNPKYNYLAALNIGDADLLRHEIAVLMSDDLEYNYLFVKNIKGADIKAHEKVILAFEDAEYSRKFIKLPGSDYDAHYEIIMRSEQKSEVEKQLCLSFPRSKKVNSAFELLRMQKAKEGKL